MRIEKKNSKARNNIARSLGAKLKKMTVQLDPDLAEWILAKMIVTGVDYQVLVNEILRDHIAQRKLWLRDARAETAARRRLARACAKMDPEEEQALAEGRGPAYISEKAKRARRGTPKTCN